ncbi:hypothetical protein ABZP12_03683 [Xanthomonas euvesicatoria]
MARVSAYTVRKIFGLARQQTAAQATSRSEGAPYRAARSKASSVIAPVSTVGRIAGGAPGP